MAQKDNEMIFSFYISTELKKEMQLLAVELGISMKEIINEGIVRFIEENKK